MEQLIENEFEERLNALAKRVVKNKEEFLEENLKIYREWVESRGRLIIFLQDTLAKVNKITANIEAENKQLMNKLEESEALAKKFYFEMVKMEAEHGFSVGEKFAQKMIAQFRAEDKTKLENLDSSSHQERKREIFEKIKRRFLSLKD